MFWLYYSILLAVMFGGLCIQVLALPGIWLMVAATAVYAWLTGFGFIGLWGLGIVLTIALCAELAEFMASSAGAKSAGGSKRAMVGAAIGGVLGGLLLSIPLPIVGTIVGVCIGAFAGATTVELLIHGEASKSARVGFGAAKGALIGILTKLTFGLIIIGFVAWRGLPIGSAAAGGTLLPAAGSPATLPATLPASSTQSAAS